MTIRDKLTKKPDGTKIPVPTHLFLFITLIFGLAFATPPALLDVGATQLFTFAASAHPAIPVIFGSTLLLTSLCNTIMLVTRNLKFGTWAVMLGFMAWFYAAIAYLVGGFFFGFIVAALPNMIFWGWYYIQVRYWREYIKQGLDQPL